MSLNQKMGDRHEAHLVEVFGGRRTRGSGNQPANPMDGRHNRYDQVVAFAWDGKSTRAKSMSIPREMLAKAREQAHGERPMIAVRFYDDDRLRGYDDWDLVQEDDLLELLDRSERLSEVEADFQAWMALGQEKGWIADGVCQTHDMVPMTKDEQDAWDDGHDPCVPVLRVWTEKT